MNYIHFIYTIAKGNVFNMVKPHAYLSNYSLGLLWDNNELFGFTLWPKQGHIVHLLFPQEAAFLEDKFNPGCYELGR